MRYIASGAHFYPLIGRNQSKPSKIVALVFPVSAIIIRFTKTHAVKITISPIIDPVIDTAREYETIRIPGADWIPGSIKPDIKLPSLDIPNLLKNPNQELKDALQKEWKCGVKYELKF